MQPTNNNGSIIIRFTKFSYKYSLTNLGKFDDHSAMRNSWQICSAIENDIDIGRFSARDSKELFIDYHPLSSLNDHHEVNNKNVDCLILVETKLASNVLRDRNLFQTANYLRKYNKPIKNNDDAMKFWQWLQSKSKGNNKTINRHLESLKPICNYFTDIPKLKTTQGKSEKPFTKSEIKQIIDIFDKDFTHYSPFIKFLFSTGCRTSEAIALTWDNVDFESRTISISESIGIANDGSKVRKSTKTGVCRVIPMGDQLHDLLNHHHVYAKANSCTDLAFYSLGYKLIDIGNFRLRVWVKALESADVPYRTLYNTRHTFCSHFLNETPDFIKLASITHGTKSGVQTLIKHYAHIVEAVTMPTMF